MPLEALEKRRPLNRQFSHPIERRLLQSVQLFRHRTWFHAAILAGLLSCGTNPEPSAPMVPQCLQADQADVTCQPLFPPEFDEIFQRTLSASCASSGVSCHGREGNMGGLILEDLTQSYDALLGRSGGRSHVIPGDPACSNLMVRLDSPGREWSMPPGTPLDERARCAIRRWIAAGAPPPANNGAL